MQAAFGCDHRCITTKEQHNWIKDNDRKKFDIDFFVLISYSHDIVRCRTNIVVMYVKRGFPNYLLFVKTIYYSNKQLIVHGKVHHNILVMKNENACNQYV